MSRSFLDEAGRDLFLEKIKIASADNFFGNENLLPLVNQNSMVLENLLVQKLNSIGPWLDLHPVLLGSWARHELCPASDLDILFLGREDQVFAFAQKAQEAGLRLRYRVPHDHNDWTQGVEAFDTLALLGAKGITKKAQDALDRQTKRITKDSKIYLKLFLSAMNQERKRRQKRLDSITNFLEPNIKSTPGGLRDIEQALSLVNWGLTDFDPHAVKILKFYKGFLLLARQRLQIDSSHDVLTGADQLELAKLFEFENLSSFMREVQKGLSRSFFYSEWILKSAAPQKKAVKPNSKFTKPLDLLRYLKKDSTIMGQKLVRESLDQVFKKPLPERLSTDQLKALQEMIGPKTSDHLIVAVFSSRLIDKLLPPVRKQVGYVQHDQYHRFTADIHLQQACRQFVKARARAKEIGALAQVHRTMSSKDWEIVGWTCLFHDLSKGSGGDHSEEGARLVKKLLPEGFISKGFRDELSWMVENHLLVSTLAFRRSPFSGKTINELQAVRATPERLKRLAVFTVIDIKATNPEAWTPWKGQLLKDFLTDVRSPENLRKQQLMQTMQKLKVSWTSEQTDELDPFILQRLPTPTLAKDLQKITESPIAQTEIFRLASRTWVRFFDPLDHPGLLAEFVDRMTEAGGNILHASVRTLPGIGVYDWFQIQLPKGRESRLKNPASTSTPLNAVKFESIEVTATGPQEWMISFKAKDQKGLLRFACARLSEIGGNIKSARVHTWGLKVEDVFVIEYTGDEAGLREKLNQL